MRKECTYRIEERGTTRRPYFKITNNYNKRTKAIIIHQNNNNKYTLLLLLALIK